MAYDWPGNMRGLEHAVEMALILSKGEHLTFSDLKIPKPVDIDQPSIPVKYGGT